MDLRLAPGRRDRATSSRSWPLLDSRTRARLLGVVPGWCSAVYETALGRNVAIKVLPRVSMMTAGNVFCVRATRWAGCRDIRTSSISLRVGVTASGRPLHRDVVLAAGSLALRVEREGPISWPEALRIGVKLCGALETAHLTGTLHRDIKPANVLVNDYGEPQLTDFGTAHIAGGYETAAGLFSGTVDYLAPEVLTGNQATVAPTFTLWAPRSIADCRQRCPYERRRAKTCLRTTGISSTRVPDLRPEGVPDAVCSAIEKAMAFDPPNDQPQRWSSAAGCSRVSAATA